ncbi:MAG: hypothetical protein J6S67_16370 [Methanobrevibacter sp.]|nr:hypothetical protein [Methanobrevibacter sp.]
MRKYGIDVSKWQGDIDWIGVKASGICKFAILKAGGSDKGFYVDPFFLKNYDMCKNLGIPVGAYYFAGPKFGSAAGNGIADAKRFEEIIKGLKFEYPIYLDIEAQPIADKEGTTREAIEFCEYLEEKGYYVGIYGSRISGFTDRLIKDQLIDYTWWVADYSNPLPVAMHQYSSKGNIPGIQGNVDLDVCTVDFPSIIKSHHLNGY